MTMLNAERAQKEKAIAAGGCTSVFCIRYGCAIWTNTGTNDNNSLNILEVE